MKILIIWATVLLTASAVMANPPSDIKASYNPENKFLTITIMHGTLAPTAHYIKSVQVDLGDQTLINQNFKSQFNKGEQAAVIFMIDLKPAAKIKVTAKCSWWGEKSKEITL